MDPVQLLTVPEVADRLRWSTRHVYRAIATGRLTAVRFGKSSHWRIREQDLATFVATADTNDPTTYRRLRAVGS